MSAQQTQTTKGLAAMVVVMTVAALASACGVDYGAPGVEGGETILDDTAAAGEDEHDPTTTTSTTTRGLTLETCAASQVWSAPNQSWFTHPGLFAFSPDGSLLARVGEYGERTAWSATEGEPLFWIEHRLGESNVDAAWTRYAALEWDGELWRAGVHAIDTGERLIELPTALSELRQLSISRDGQRVAGLACLDDRLQVLTWSADTGVLLSSSSPELTCRSWAWPFRLPAAFTSDHSALVLGGDGGELIVVDTATGAWRSTQAHDPAPDTVAAPYVPEAAVLALALAPDGASVASVGVDGNLRVHRLHDLALTAQADGVAVAAPINLDSYMPSVSSPLVWSPDGALLAHQDQNGSVTLRRASDLQRVRTFEAPARDTDARGEGWGPVSNPTVDIAFSPTSDAIAVSFETNLALWRCDAAAPLPSSTEALTVTLDAPTTATVGQEITLEAYAPDAAPLRGHTFLVDGALIELASTASRRTWTFTSPGTWTVEVLVQDGAREGRATRTIEVRGE